MLAGTVPFAASRVTVRHRMLDIGRVLSTKRPPDTPTYVILSFMGIEAVEFGLMSLISPSRLHTASFTSTFSATRPSPFLIGNDRGSVLKFPTSDSTITRHLAKKSRAGAGRVRPDGENGPRCNLKPLPSNRPILYFLILVVSSALSRDLMTGSTGYRAAPCWVHWNFGRVPPSCTGIIFAASCA